MWETETQDKSVRANILVTGKVSSAITIIGKMSTYTKFGATSAPAFSAVAVLLKCTIYTSLSLSLFLASSNLIQFCPCRSLCNFSASLNIHVGNYATTIVNLMGQTMPTLYQPIKLQQAIKYELYRKVDTQQQVSLCSPPPSPFSVCVCVYISP